MYVYWRRLIIDGETVRAAEDLPGASRDVVLLIGPRGSGKSHRLASLVAAARERGDAAHWLDAAQDDRWRPDDRADLVAIDAVDPRHDAHIALVRAVLEGARAGRIVRVVIASRSAALLEAGRFGSVSPLAALRTSALALDADGVLAVAEHAGARIDAVMAAAIAEESDGWAWAARIAVAVAAGERFAHPDDFRLACRRRLRNAALPELSEDRRVLFTATSTLDPTLVAAAGVPDPDAWLAEAEADGWLFRDAADPHFRVPAALTRALREQPDPSPERLAQIRRVLVDALQLESRFPELIDVALASDDVELILEVAHLSGRMGRLTDLYRISEALQGKDLAWFGSHLDLFGAVTLLSRGSSRHYSAWLQAAAELARIEPARIASPTDLLYLHVIRIVAFRATGDLDASLLSSERAVDDWQRTRTRHPHASGAAAIALDSAAMSFMLNNEYGRAVSAAGEAARIARTIGDPYLVASTVSALGTIHTVHGDLVAAEAAFSEAQQVHLQEPEMRVLPRVGRSLLDVERGELPAARASAEAATRLGAETDHWWLAEYARAVVHGSGAGAARGEAYGDAVEERGAQGYLVSAPEFHGFRLAELHILDGALPRAEAVLSGLGTTHPYATVLQGVIELAGGNWAEAHRCARVPYDDAPPRQRALRGLVVAATAASFEHTRVAADRLAPVLRKMRRWGLGSPIAFLTAEARDLLAQAARGLDPSLRAYLDAQLARYAPLAVRPAVTAALSARELEVLEHLGGDATLAGISSALGVSLNTVKTHVRRTYQKLGARSRSEAIDRAIAAGLISGCDS